MKRHFNEKFAFLLVAMVFWLSEPAITHAEGAKYHPLIFFQPLSIGRGTLTPVNAQGLYLNKEETCTILVQANGVPLDQCPNFDLVLFNPVADIEMVIFSAPSDEGRVSYDGWDSELAEEFETIENAFEELSREQGRALGQTIEFTGWKIYPTLDKQRNLLYYAYGISLNGKAAVSIKFSLFDRYGVWSGVVRPANHISTTEELEDALNKLLAMYKPDAGSSYAEWQTGDNVAAVGVVGVLASLAGVK